MDTTARRFDSNSDADSWFADDQQLANSPDRLKYPYVDEGRPLPWAEAVDVFCSDHGTEDRFGRRWASGLWGRWLSRDRALVEWTETTLMLSLTASPWLTPECLLPPAHHLDGVLNGRDAVLSRLSDCLDAEYRVGWALGANKNGYAHCHVGVWCSDRTEATTVEPALRAYVDAVPMADQDEHGTGAVTAYHGEDILAYRTSTDDCAPATKLGAYLVDNVPGSGSQPGAGMGVDNELGAGDGHRVQLATLLDATDTMAYRRPDR